MPSSTVVPVGRENGISIASLNPDTDGDGKVEAWETEVFDRIKKADEDQSGTISVKELFNVIKDHESLVDEFCLEITRCVLGSLKMCHNSLEFS